jgi:hypothetical protein
LLKKNQWTDDHQAFHDFYYKRLKYDFKKEWHAKHNQPFPRIDRCAPLLDT